MSHKSKNILIVESSQIIYEGLSAILSRSSYCTTIFRINDIDDIDKSLLYNSFGLVLVNAAQVQNRRKAFESLIGAYKEINWIGMLTSLVEDDILSIFKKIIKVDNSEDEILKLIQDIDEKEIVLKTGILKGEKLSGRETDVLIQLVNGFSNKEIAENLNISIHTVISHRKNISQKTGIKSQSGLTIYAISNKIVDIDNF